MMMANQYVFDLDEFEMELQTLVTELRKDEETYVDPDDRRVAYARTVQRLGFTK